MRATTPQQLKIVYEFVPPDPDGKNTRMELERGFDVLFDIVLKELEAEVLEKRGISKQERVLSGARAST